MLGVGSNPTRASKIPFDLAQADQRVGTGAVAGNVAGGCLLRQDELNPHPANGSELLAAINRADKLVVYISSLASERKKREILYSSLKRRDISELESLQRPHPRADAPIGLVVGPTALLR
jgi:hypothetical protein